MKKKKTARKKISRKAKSVRSQKLALQARRTVRKKATPKRKPALRTKKKPIAAKNRKQKQSVKIMRGKPEEQDTLLGAGAGDLQGISVVEDVDFESPRELIEEGQAFEAGIVSGVEDAPTPDRGEVKTHEVLEDDVPLEYDDDRP